MSMDFPKGASFGRDSNRRRPGLVDYGWTAENGSRAQRRAAVRIIRNAASQGDSEAAAVLAELQTSAQSVATLVWLVRAPGRKPFKVICPQRATASEIRAQWPGSEVEAIHE